MFGLQRNFASFLAIKKSYQENKDLKKRSVLISVPIKPLGTKIYKLKRLEEAKNESTH